MNKMDNLVDIAFHSCQIIIQGSTQVKKNLTSYVLEGDSRYLNLVDKATQIINEATKTLRRCEEAARGLSEGEVSTDRPVVGRKC